MTRIYHSRSPASIFGEFRKTMMDAGVMAPVKIIADGKLRNFATSDTDLNEAGSYVLDLNGFPVGWFRDHKTGIEQYWYLDIGRTLSAQEEAMYQAQITKIREKRDIDDMVRNEVAKAKSINIWKAASPAKADHPYLVREQIVPTATLREILAEDAARILGYVPDSNGEPLQGHLIVVREMTDHRISKLELIDEKGRKSTVTGGTIGSARAAKGTR
jgi:putative DNA primase/helicase